MAGACVLFSSGPYCASVSCGSVVVAGTLACTHAGQQEKKSHALDFSLIRILIVPCKTQFFLKEIDSNCIYLYFGFFSKMHCNLVQVQNRAKTGPKQGQNMARTGPEQGQSRARTGPEQGFPYVVTLTLQGTPLLIAGILYSLQVFPCENYYTGRSL